MGILSSKINVIQVLSIILMVLQETDIINLIPQQYVWIFLIVVNVLTIIVRTYMSKTLPPVKFVTKKKK